MQNTSVAISQALPMLSGTLIITEGTLFNHLQSLHVSCEDHGSEFKILLMVPWLQKGTEMHRGTREALGGRTSDSHREQS